MIITRILLPLSAVNTVALLVGIMLPSLLLAQSAPTSGLVEPGRPSEKKPGIVRFHVENEGKGALHIIYGDGTQVEILKHIPQTWGVSQLIGWPTSAETD